MSRRSSKKAENLFNIFAESAANSGFGAGWVFHCPLCMREFTDFGKNWENKQLSLEHVPMKAVGPKIEILTCSNCNHLFGYKYQPSLETAQILQRIARQEDTKWVKAAIKSRGRQLRGRIRFEQGEGFAVKESVKGSPPEYSNYWNRKGPSISLHGLEVRLELPLDQDAAMRSLLRDAYLFMFNCWGCWLLKESWSDEIRHRLLDATIPIPKGAVVRMPFLPLDSDPASGEFLFVTDPKDLRCYLVPVLDRCVCLPAQGDTRKCTELWKRFEDVATTGHRMELGLQKIVFHESVKTSPQLKVLSILDQSGQFVDHLEVIGIK